MSQINLNYNVPVWKINGLEFEFDTEDPSTWVRYENAYKAFQDKVKHRPKDGGRSGLLKFEMKIIKELFNDVFGHNAGTQIFKGQPNNRRYYYAVHNDFVKFVDRCREESDDAVIKLADTGGDYSEPSVGKLA